MTSCQDALSARAGICRAVVRIALLSPACAALPSHAEVFKCVDAAGAIVYQQGPCASGAPQVKLDAPAPPRAAESGPASMDAFNVMMTLAFKRYCDDSLPGFAERVSLDWNRWRTGQQLRTIREVEAMPQYAQSLKEPPERFGNFTREDARFVCTADWVRSLADGEQARGLAFASTPESTWRHLVDALARADRTAALAAYAVASRPKFGRVFEVLTDEQLRRQGTTWRLIGPGTGTDEWREYMIQDGSRAYSVQFYRFGKDWLILEM